MISDNAIALGAALFVASSRGEVENVRHLITDHTVDEISSAVNFQDELGWTPLMKATAEGHYQIVQVLCDVKADVNAKNLDGYTPLIVAAAEGQVHIIKLLVSNGAHLNLQDEEGCTALLWGCRSDAFAAQLLLSFGADVNIANKDGLTPLMAAMCNNQHETVRLLLLKPQIDINAYHQDGSTALMGAIADGNLPMVQMLLLAGAQLTIKEDELETPPHPPSSSTFTVAVESERAQLVRLLESFLVHPAVTNAGNVKTKGDRLAILGSDNSSSATNRSASSSNANMAMMDTGNLRIVIEEFIECQTTLLQLQQQLVDEQRNAVPASEVEAMRNKVRDLEQERETLYDELQTMKTELAYAEEESSFMSKELANAKISVEDLRIRAANRVNSKRLNTTAGGTDVVANVFSGLFCQAQG